MDDDGIEIDGFDEDDDPVMHWEQFAQQAAERVLSNYRFDEKRRLVVVDDEDLSADDLDALVVRIAEEYDEQWYANVPFESGEAVFDSDSHSFAAELLDDKGFYAFFDKLDQQRAGKLVLVVAEKGDSGILVPRDSVLELKELGLFTSEQIAELQELMNSENASEADLQEFFERNPHFLTRWNLPNIHPHVRLSRRSGGVLIPDFVLCNPNEHKAAIIDLKLPSTRLVRRQKNRDRWAGAISEARTQLLRYRDWFDEETNRKSLISEVGMEVYKPALAVLVGRGSDFRSAFEKQQLVADLPDVEIMTYDDLASWAAKRTVP